MHSHTDLLALPLVMGWKLLKISILLFMSVLTSQEDNHIVNPIVLKGGNNAAEFWRQRKYFFTMCLSLIFASSYHESTTTQTPTVTHTLFICAHV